MHTSEVIVAAIGGMALGGLHLLGLWYTVRSVSKSTCPELVFVISYFARMTVFVAGFWLVMSGRWERAIAAMAGFLLVRTIVICRERARIGGLAGRRTAVHPLEH